MVLLPPSTPATAPATAVSSGSGFRDDILVVIGWDDEIRFFSRTGLSPLCVLYLGLRGVGMMTLYFLWARESSRLLAKGTVQYSVIRTMSVSAQQAGTKGGLLFIGSFN